MHRTNWDDLRFVLAVAESGSVSGAARVLGVNHATVLRRIAAFETAQGTAVFDRTAQGYVILPDKLRVIDAARRAALAMDQVDNLLRGNGTTAPKRITVTSTDTLCQTVLPRALLKLPCDLGQVDLSSTNDHLDLARLRADITLRPAIDLPPELSGEVVGQLAFGVYARVGATPDVWHGVQGVLGRTQAANWMADTLDADQIVGGADSFLVLRELAAQSGAYAVLPRVLGDGDPRLRMCDTPMPDYRVPIWVASHTQVASLPRLQRFRTGLSVAMQDMATELDPR